MDMAIQNDRPIKKLDRERLGQDILFAFDERKRTLAVCASVKVPHRRLMVSVLMYHF
jgi:hypothetical protein